METGIITKLCLNRRLKTVYVLSQFNHWFQKKSKHLNILYYISNLINYY